MWTGTVAPLRAGGKMLPDRKQRNGRRIGFLLTSLSPVDIRLMQPFQFFCLFVILGSILDFGVWILETHATDRKQEETKKDKEKSLS